MNIIESYPLYWPEGHPRSRYRTRSKFHCTFDRERKNLEDEIRRLGGSALILSTNIPLRRDGAPYATFKRVVDVGVAVYFKYRDTQMVFACDKWDLVEHNLRSITKTIEAIRGIERWGSSEMLERAFRGFRALPAPENSCQILGVSKGASLSEIKSARNRLAIKYHPDNGSTPNPEMMAKVNQAFEELSRGDELGGLTNG